MIAIVDYGAGNLTSVRLAFERIGAACEITNDPSRVAAAERVVFPGVGAAAEAMRNLRELRLIDAIKAAVTDRKPFLGICLGAQLILESSEEDGGTPCIGLVPGAARRLTPSDPLCKIPHMGWNTVRIVRPHPVLMNVAQDSEFYFVHSYYPDPSDPRYVIGETEYAGARFASAIGQDNLFAAQFHPERSGRIGLKLLENFCGWDGQC